jgi:hypothetical protein
MIPPPRPVIVHYYRSLKEALTAAKRNRLYYGRVGDEFRVYESGTVIERYVVGSGD